VSSHDAARPICAPSLSKPASAVSNSLRSWRYCSAIMLERLTPSAMPTKVVDVGGGVALAGTLSGSFGGRLRCIGERHANQFRNGDEFKTFLLRADLECTAWPRLFPGGYRGITQSSRSSLFSQSDCRLRWPRTLPIKWINIPENDLVAELIVDRTFLSRGK